MAARLVAIPAAYALASLACAVLARLLPVARPEAATWGILPFFALLALLVMAAFATRNIIRLWLWWGGGAAILGVVLALSLQASGRA